MMEVNHGFALGKDPERCNNGEHDTWLQNALILMTLFNSWGGSEKDTEIFIKRSGNPNAAMFGAMSAQLEELTHRIDEIQAKAKE